MGRKADLTGQRFGSLTVIEESPERKNGAVCWLCKCDCGKITKPIRNDALKSGEIVSCGCFRSKSIQQRNFVHGFFLDSKRKQHAYVVWTGMKQRCFNQNSKDYKHYGGRGIAVCDEWKDNFQAFYDHVSQLPHFGEEGYSLDRINNDGNYKPGNVRWATAKEQMNNRRNVRKECGQTVSA